MSPLPRHPGVEVLRHGRAVVVLPSPTTVPSVTKIGSAVVKAISSDIVTSWLKDVNQWVGDGGAWLFRGVWDGLSATTDPVLTGQSFSSELQTMAVLGASIVLPLLGLSVIQAIVHQDASGLVRTVLLKMPMALMFTGVAVEIVSLSLTIVDRVSTSLISQGGDSAGKMFLHLEVVLTTLGGVDVGAFGVLLVLLVVAFVSLVVWVELAVRSAAVAVATLFLPLALAGLVWPSTSQWAKRLGETLAALVLMKLVMAAVLTLAAGALQGVPGNKLSGVVEGLSLLLIACFCPFALMRLIPVVEAGAVAHLEGVSQRGMAPITSRAASFPSSLGGELHEAYGRMKGQASGSATGSATGQTPPGPEIPEDLPSVMGGGQSSAPGSGGTTGGSPSGSPGRPSGGSPGGAGPVEPDGAVLGGSGAGPSAPAGSSEKPNGPIGGAAWDERIDIRQARLDDRGPEFRGGDQSGEP